jgi:uncharacterized protein
MLTAEQLIKQYLMLPHPEGGWYRENYRSNEIFPATALPDRYGGNRVFSTAIYFLLEKGDCSAFHRIKSDECWHFYAGAPMELFVIHADGSLETVLLGSDLEKSQVFQYIVPAGCWFASRPETNGDFSFVGCTVAPGFDFADFELADPDMLSAEYPRYEKIIRSMVKV